MSVSAVLLDLYVGDRSFSRDIFKLQRKHTCTDLLLANVSVVSRVCVGGEERQRTAYLLILSANARRSGSDAIRERGCGTSSEGFNPPCRSAELRLSS